MQGSTDGRKGVGRKKKSWLRNIRVSVEQMFHTARDRYAKEELYKYIKPDKLAMEIKIERNIAI